MRFKTVWQLQPHYGWLLSAIVSLSLLALLTALDSQAENVAPLLLNTAGILLFVFLARLPDGTWWQRLLYEAALLAGSLLLFVLSVVLYNVLQPDNLLQTTDTEILLPFTILNVFSHIAVRLFARPYAIWEQMRRRRLVWEITHAQLRLVMLVMLFLFIGLITLNLSNNVFLVQSVPNFVSNVVTMFIAVGGFLGIVTGVLLFVVVLPASVVSYLTARRITRRLDDLVRVTQSVRNADYNARVTVQGEDEIADLQRNFNAMMDELNTARRNLEEERDAVRQLLASRRRLFADVSHELRTPVATIRAHLNALATRQAAPQTDSQQVIEREALRLQRLIDDVFTLARADVQQLTFDIQPLEAGQILEHTAQTIQKQAWQTKRIDVVLDYQPQLPLIRADKTRLEQVLYNLLRNAIRHTPPGGLIRVSAAYDDDSVTLSVQDTGEGISPDDLPHIWKRFYRSSDARADSSGGAGLGLALVKEMVEAMDGSVSVSSTPGRGSRFSVTLCRVSSASNE
jgi:signal transduction histidine kinase